MTVDLGAIQRNFLKLSAMTTGLCAAVVKGDGYGHGMEQSALALRDVGGTLFFSARYDDALTLRRILGGDVRIAALDGIPRECIREALAHDITPVVNSLDQLEACMIAARSQDRKVDVFVHLDTGMNRLGLAPGDDRRAAPMLDALNVLAYMTHFASADDTDLEFCRRQASELRTRAGLLPPAPLSIANSCGVFLDPAFHEAIIRPGKSTFGINPLVDDINPMEEPASVLAPVVQVRTLKTGDPVGYSCSWRAPGPRRIALLAIGYGNGLFRSQGSKGTAALAGRKVPIIGRVSMDLTAVDISTLPDRACSVGSCFEMLGKTIGYREFATASGTNEHEALISLGRGCRRSYFGTV